MYTLRILSTWKLRVNLDILHTDVFIETTDVLVCLKKDIVNTECLLKGHHEN